MIEQESIKDRLKEFIRFKGLTVREFERAIGVSNGYVGSIRVFPSPDVLSAIALKFPDLNKSWLFFGEESMFAPVSDPAPEEKLYPHLPINASAGFSEDLENGIYPDDCLMQPKLPGFPEYDLTIGVTGNSMFPTFQSGDRLALRRCRNFIQWGSPHVLDTSEGIYLKRITENADDIICTSDNADYPPFNIPKSCIRAIYKIVGYIHIF